MAHNSEAYEAVGRQNFEVGPTAEGLCACAARARGKKSGDLESRARVGGCVGSPKCRVKRFAGTCILAGEPLSSIFAERVAEDQNRSVKLGTAVSFRLGERERPGGCDASDVRG